MLLLCKDYSSTVDKIYPFDSMQELTKFYMSDKTLHNTQYYAYDSILNLKVKYFLSGKELAHSWGRFGAEVVK